MSTPEYRYRILEDEIKQEVEQWLYKFVERQGEVIEELNVQKDHVHLLVSVLPKISSFVVSIKGQISN